MIYLKTFSFFYSQNILFVVLLTEVFSVPHQAEPRKITYSSSENGYNFTGLSYPAEIASLQQENSQVDLNQTLLATAMWHPNNTVCYEDLGCITRFSFADPILWPINLLPDPREKINTHFTLYTREQPYDAAHFVRISAKNPNGIMATSFKVNRLTKFYIHGWQSTGYQGRHKTFVERLLANNDANVIIVHWGGGANTNYDHAHANIRLVGLEVAFLVNTMIVELGVKASDVHLIGHSLGAHTAGYAGEKIFQLGRITGLDPAGPYFRGMPSFACLDPSDALFVEAVHTDGGFLDFYPNGGLIQPGCDPSNLPTNSDESVITCSHARSIHLYSESFLSDDSCQSIGYECSDYESFNKGHCTSCGSDNTQCAPFGLQANTFPIGDRINVKIFFNTGPDFPFCRYHYAVNINLAKPQEAKDHIKGKLRLSVTGDRDILLNIKLPLTYLKHGGDNTFLLTVPTNVGRVEKVNLRWKYAMTDLLDWLDGTCSLGFCNKRLYVNSVTISELNNYPEEKRIANTFKNCPQFVPGVIRNHWNLDFTTGNSCVKTIQPLFSWFPLSWFTHQLDSSTITSH
ncbi:pancreatic lipase-related protein 2-like isoform X2 [Daphnia pulicaria]|uniref:pancreatic lipase-related protein 2-like isoform X2 n=1 Tax=Daphnia pulicaria TaxID=35523 RepID=UPI001EEC566C|nr:pancreatic lipase-related protein 2-like isoform X2 [Daphnia pulicaria]